ncbi:RNA polymerase sigma factor [Sphingomonas quercus]|uniref:Sigma-70 family RNA polymerase sigma factor n=1 Tax=Sphingomonas quercus TaxID=2842451 RepID=A0ABS6BD70_9SPHN|nr:sigma-70 family RNA polymerase sigma factor [Sphingomonas quercus]MBU3076265.1 sigma-70 family RNA polymerase sigma factor [Sphingomonas quercus]
MFTSSRAEIPLDRKPASDVVHYLGGLRAFFVKRVAPCDVDDMVQEVVLRMQVRRSEMGIGNFEGYLFQVAHSVLTDRGRRDQVRRRSQHSPLEEPDHPVEEISPARVLEGKQQLALLIAALKELPDRTRQIFVLHRFEEMSYGGIARHLGISVSAVEKHIMKAIRHLAARAGE